MLLSPYIQPFKSIEQYDYFHEAYPKNARGDFGVFIDMLGDKPLWFKVTARTNSKAISISKYHNLDSMVGGGAFYEGKPTAVNNTSKITLMFGDSEVYDYGNCTIKGGVYVYADSDYRTIEIQRGIDAEKYMEVYYELSSPETMLFIDIIDSWYDNGRCVILVREWNAYISSYIKLRNYYARDTYGGQGNSTAIFNTYSPIPTEGRTKGYGDYTYYLLIYNGSDCNKIDLSSAYLSLDMLTEAIHTQSNTVRHVEYAYKSHDWDIYTRHEISIDFEFTGEVLLHCSCYFNSNTLIVVYSTAETATQIHDEYLRHYEAHNYKKVNYIEVTDPFGGVSYRQEVDTDEWTILQDDEVYFARNELWNSLFGYNMNSVSGSIPMYYIADSYSKIVGTTEVLVDLSFSPQPPTYTPMLHLPTSALVNMFIGIKEESSFFVKGSFSGKMMSLGVLSGSPIAERELPDLSNSSTAVSIQYLSGGDLIPDVSYEVTIIPVNPVSMGQPLTTTIKVEDENRALAKLSWEKVNGATHYLVCTYNKYSQRIYSVQLITTKTEVYITKSLLSRTVDKTKIIYNVYPNFPATIFVNKV